MSVEHHREREVTFDVDDDWVVPDISTVAPQGGRVETAQHELAATYFDTDRSTLRLLGMTLRHRDGGADAGWPQKSPPWTRDRGPEPGRCRLPSRGAAPTGRGGRRGDRCVRWRRSGPTGIPPTSWIRR